jgi:hypothetical protein
MMPLELLDHSVSVISGSIHYVSFKTPSLTGNVRQVPCVESTAAATWQRRVVRLKQSARAFLKERPSPLQELLDVQAHNRTRHLRGAVFVQIEHLTRLVAERGTELERVGCTRASSSSEDIEFRHIPDMGVS